MIDRLNALGAAWKAQFDNPPTLSLLWSLDAGVLALNGVGVCPAADLCPEGEEYDLEWLRLPLQTGYVDIVIDWPYESDARISEIVTHKEVPAA
jgi:hypothetical protein